MSDFVSYGKNGGDVYKRQTLTVQDAGGSDNPDTPNNTYQIIDGANSSWTHDSDGNITILSLIHI